MAFYQETLRHVLARNNMAASLISNRYYGTAIGHLKLSLSEARSGLVSRDQDLVTPNGKSRNPFSSSPEGSSLDDLLQGSRLDAPDQGMDSSSSSSAHHVSRTSTALMRPGTDVFPAAFPMAIGRTAQGAEADQFVIWDQPFLLPSEVASCYADGRTHSIIVAILIFNMALAYHMLAEPEPVQSASFVEPMEDGLPTEDRKHPSAESYPRDEQSTPSHSLDFNRDPSTPIIDAAHSGEGDRARDEHSRRMRTSLLEKAIRLYDSSLRLLVSVPAALISPPRWTIFHMAVANNLGRCHKQLGRSYASDTCLQHLLDIIMIVLFGHCPTFEDSAATQEDNPVRKLAVLFSPNVAHRLLAGSGASGNTSAQGFSGDLSPAA